MNKYNKIGDMKRQSLKNKKAEVSFRKKLSLQFQGKKTYYPGQPDKKEYLKILKERVDSTRETFKKLKKKGVTLSPYLEIGAERGQRSLLLENEFGAKGFATDLSLDSLKAADNLLKKLKYKKMPARVVCDAENLPFRSNSFPFVFCYQTLHHFPNPTPILEEIRRVLAPRGYFYFGEEPVKQLVNLRLWHRDYRLKSWEKILKAIGLLPFISGIGESEISEGVLEEEFDIKTWEAALNVFDKAKAVLIPYFIGPISKVQKNGEGWLNPNIITRAFLGLTGGGIEALCQTTKLGKRVSYRSLLTLLRCPNCKSNLQTQRRQIFCKSCKRRFEKKDGIYMLLSHNTLRQLYP